MLRGVLAKKNRKLLILVELELLVVLVLFLSLWRTGLNAGNVEKYASSEDIPVITAEDGYLAYNKVRVKVPEAGATYAVGYDWAEEDTDYPSIPTSAAAVYTGKEGQDLYDIILYRDKVTPKGDGSDQYTLEMWRADWVKTAESAENQEAYNTTAAKGFLIRTETEDGNGAKENCSYTYYFAVETERNIEQFVFEMSFYDPKYIAQAEKLFKACADSISVRASA